MADIRIGKVRDTVEEMEERILQVNGGVRLGKDADGNPGYVVTDAETGADTVVPFSSSGKNGLPIKGTICFAGTGLNCVDGTANQYICNLFDVPLEISKVKEIKTITNIINWYRINSGYTANLSRNMYIYLLAESSDGRILMYNSRAIISLSGTGTINVSQEEFIFPIDTVSDCKYILGIGCRFSQYGGGSNLNYYFKSQIGSNTEPDKAKMEYIIS